MYEFKMPSLGAEMESGRLVEWKVKPGDKVKKQDIIAVVDTDKAAIEIECWQAGTVEKLIVEPGEKVPVGTVLALIREETPTTEAAPPVKTEEERSERLKITPRARNLAQKFGVDVHTIKGTGSSGEITEADIQKLGSKEPPKEEQVVSMQKVIAAAMARSKREIPHYYISNEIDMTSSLNWLEKHNNTKPPQERIIYAALLIKALASAAKNHPESNGFFTDGNFRKANDVNVGVVISLRQGGLLAPAICHADQMSLGELMTSLTDVVTRARAGNLRSSEVSDSTITMTNLGENGADSVFGVIYPPQVAIIGFGKINSRKTIIASLSGDHRVSDGHRGSRFLSTIGQYLQSPEKL